jgi:signal transduction histidine kinase
VKIRFVSNLQSKVVVVFLLASVVPLGVVSLVAIRTADRVIEDIVTNQLENVAAEKQDLLQKWIAERRADIDVVAGCELLRNLDPRKMGSYLESMQREYEVYRQFTVTDRRGQVLYQTSGDFDRARVEECCRRALDGSAYMSEVALDAAGRESVFLLAAAIPGPDGGVEGAVCATVSTAPIHHSILKVSLGETGECYLVDKAGTFLAHKDPRRILRDNIADSGSFRQIFQSSRPNPVYTDYRRIAVLGASRGVEGTPWYLVVEQDRDEAFAPSYRLKRSIYAVLALTVAGAVGLSVAMAIYVAAPIGQLSEAAHALARGDFQHALPEMPNGRRDEIGILYDAFRYMADQLHDREARLENRVGLTEAELQRVDARLQDTLQAAARSEQLAALGRLAAGVAHEIRTPLTSLKLYLQSLQEDVTISPEHAEDFDLAMEQVTRIESTINQFLDYARPREPVFAEVDFRRLVDGAMTVVRPRANHQDVEVEVSVSPALPAVSGDVRQLNEAVVNLLVNALEEMPGGGRLRFSVRPELPDQAVRDRQWVGIEVADTGPGIAEENIELLFEPFFTTKAAGSGLGLAIVRGIVQRHGGILQVRNRPEGGATFRILLPALQAEIACEHG